MLSDLQKLYVSTKGGRGVDDVVFHKHIPYISMRRHGMEVMVRVPMDRMIKYLIRHKSYISEDVLKYYEKANHVKLME